MIPKQLHEGLLFVVYQVRARSEALKDLARAQQGQLLARNGPLAMSAIRSLTGGVDRTWRGQPISVENDPLDIEGSGSLQY